MAIKYLILLLLILPNLNLLPGLPVFDFIISLFFAYNLYQSKKLNITIGGFLLFSFCILIPITIFKLDYHFEYLDFWLRYLLTLIILLFPNKIFFKHDLEEWFLDFLFIFLLGIGIYSILQGTTGLIFRREIEIFGYNDLNIYLINLLLISILGRFSILKVLIVIMVSGILGSRTVFISGLLYLTTNNIKFLAIMLLVTVSYFIYLNPDLISNIELINRVNSGLEDNEYSRLSIWKLYIKNSLNLCPYCSLSTEFSQIGLNIFRPAHNSILSAIGILGFIPGMIFISFLFKKLKTIFTYKGFWLLPIVMFFDIQYTRGSLFLIIMILLNEKFRSTNTSIQ